MSTYELSRPRFADVVRRALRSPAFVAFLLVADGVEMALSLALAAAAPVAVPRQASAVPAFEAPYMAPAWSGTAALLALALGVWIAATLAIELVWLVRIRRLERWRRERTPA